MNSAEDEALLDGLRREVDGPIYQLTAQPAAGSEDHQLLVQQQAIEKLMSRASRDAMKTDYDSLSTAFVFCVRITRVVEAAQKLLVPEFFDESVIHQQKLWLAEMNKWALYVGGVNVKPKLIKLMRDMKDSSASPRAPLLEQTGAERTPSSAQAYSSNATAGYVAANYCGSAAYHVQNDGFSSADIAAAKAASLSSAASPASATQHLASLHSKLRDRESTSAAARQLGSVATGAAAPARSSVAPISYPRIYSATAANSVATHAASVPTAPLDGGLGGRVEGAGLGARPCAANTSAVATTLRELVLPRSIVLEFIALSAAATAMPGGGIETGGMLLGRLERSRLVVSVLVLPEQHGNSDFFEMTAEGEMDIFNLCLQESLITLGWIHTHPSQGCFLSAIDLHTHVGYQSTIQEAIALVVAPNDPVVRAPGGRFAAFRLTDESTPLHTLRTPQPDFAQNYTHTAHPLTQSPLFSGYAGSDLTGIDLIKACSTRGFHPHLEAHHMTIYEMGSHVHFDDAALRVVDLRVRGGGEQVAPAYGQGALGQAQAQLQVQPQAQRSAGALGYPRISRW